jgi:hypothetical protein
MDSITQFAKIHQFDDRHTYKEAWEVWLESEHASVETEVARLQQLAYTGDVIDKMFKAGRYYFREKKEEAKAKPKTKRDYIVMHPSISQAMDRHLLNLMQLPDFKPAVAYNHFCEEHGALLRTEIGRLAREHNTLTGEQMSMKFKKTYKNRYFNLHKV